MARLRGGVVDTALPKESEYRGLSVSKTVGVRVRVALEWAVQTLINRETLRKRLQQTKALKDVSRGKPAVVLATGPSLLSLDVPALEDLREKGARIFAVNFFSETSVAHKIRPDYYVLADPAFLSLRDATERTDAVWRYIQHEPRPVVCLPAHTNLEDVPNDGKFLFFNSIGLDGWTRNISPVKPRGFLGLTAYHAISLAIYLGHDPIFTLGIDNDAFKSVTTVEGGKLALTAHHAYQDNRNYPLPASSLEVPAMLEDYARHFADLNLFPTKRLINLAPSTLITAYRTGNLREWLQ